MYMVRAAVPLFFQRFVDDFGERRGRELVGPTDTFLHHVAIYGFKLCPGVSWRNPGTMEAFVVIMCVDSCGNYGSLIHLVPD